MKYLIFSFIIFININICFADSISVHKNKFITDPTVNNSYQLNSEYKSIIDWNNLSSGLIGGIIGGVCCGIICILPTIISYFKKVKIKGRLISIYSLLNLDSEAFKIVYLQKLSIFSENKNFYLKDIDVYVKYFNEAEISCKCCIWHTFVLPFKVNNKYVNKKLLIEKINYLLHCTVFPKEKEISGYISFFATVQRDYNLTNVEYFRYLFKDYKGNVKEMMIHVIHDHDNQTIYLNEDAIWQETV